MDAVLETLRVGKFTWLAALLLGLANASDAIELLCVSFILPSFGSLTDEQKGVLSATVFVGMLLGGLPAGVQGDALGRRPVLITALAINAGFGALSAALDSWEWLALCRVLAGVGVGGSIPTLFTLFVEFLPTKGRGFFISVVAFFWTVGTIYAAGMAWIMLGLLQGSWRGFAVVCSLPAATTAVLVWALLPESPRYLWKRGQFAKAADALDLIAWWNGGGHGVDLTRDVRRGVGANNTAPSSRGVVDPPSSPGGLDDATANLISGSPSGASGETPTSPLASASAPSPTRRPSPPASPASFLNFSAPNCAAPPPSSACSGSPSPLLGTGWRSGFPPCSPSPTCSWTRTRTRLWSAPPTWWVASSPPFSLTGSGASG